MQLFAIKSYTEQQISAKYNTSQYATKVHLNFEHTLVTMYIDNML